MLIIYDMNTLLASKLEWCHGLALWDKEFEQFVFARESYQNDPDELEEDYDEEGNLIVERSVYNAWCANVEDFFVTEGSTILTLGGDYDIGGLACPRVDMPMNEFISLLCAMCGENFERPLTEEECRERFVLIKYYASATYVDLMKNA